MRTLRLLLALSALAVFPIACGGDDAPDRPATQDDPSGGELTIYSGREKDLAGPLIERFQRQTNVDVEVRYADSAELAATILEEGDNSPADVFFSQDAGALGALGQEERLAKLDAEVLRRVPRRFRSARGDWVGASGRARIVAYDKRAVREADLPPSILDLTARRWRGKLGWAPTNASFQTFVTAMRLELGEDRTRRWLEGILANDVQTYEGNTPIRDAIASGEIELGLINHYYVAEAVAEEGADYPVGVHVPEGDIGALVNAAGAGILAGAEHGAEAARFVRFLLSTEAQRYFAQETKEYPLVAGVRADASLVALADIDQPDVDLNRLTDLQGTVSLLQDVGAL